MTTQNISAKELKKLLDNNEAVVIDVRTKEEHDLESIQGNIFLPLAEISCDDLPKTNKKIVIHCKKGMRGEKACDKLTCADPSLVLYNLEGGIDAWKQEGFEVITSNAKKVLPLNQQVFLALGAVITLSSVMIILDVVSFSLITLAVGCGLIYAGLSGNCFLAKMLSRMPWNK